MNMLNAVKITKIAKGLKKCFYTLEFSTCGFHKSCNLASLLEVTDNMESSPVKEGNSTALLALPRCRVSDGMNQWRRATNYFVGGCENAFL